MTSDEIRPPVKLGAFGIVLAAAIALGFVVGSAVAPIDVGGGHSDDAPTSIWEHEHGH